MNGFPHPSSREPYSPPAGHMPPVLTIKTATPAAIPPAPQTAAAASNTPVSRPSGPFLCPDDHLPPLPRHPTFLSHLLTTGLLPPKPTTPFRGSDGSSLDPRHRSPVPPPPAPRHGNRLSDGEEMVVRWVCLGTQPPPLLQTQSISFFFQPEFYCASFHSPFHSPLSPDVATDKAG